MQRVRCAIWRIGWSVRAGPPFGSTTRQREIRPAPGPIPTWWRSGSPAYAAPSSMSATLGVHADRRGGVADRSHTGRRRARPRRACGRLRAVGSVCVGESLPAGADRVGGLPARSGGRLGCPTRRGITGLARARRRGVGRGSGCDVLRGDRLGPDAGCHQRDRPGSGEPGVGAGSQREESSACTARAPDTAPGRGGRGRGSRSPLRRPARDAMGRARPHCRLAGERQGAPGADQRAGRGDVSGPPQRWSMRRARACDGARPGTSVRNGQRTRGSTRGSTRSAASDGDLPQCGPVQPPWTGPALGGSRSGLRQRRPHAVRARRSERARR